MGAAGFEAREDFAAWQDRFDRWVDALGYPRNLLGDFRFEPKYADPPSGRIGFGGFQGQLRWRTLREVPRQDIRDALLALITVQGDTEFASVEQQKHLIETAPTAYDRKSLVRVNAEEMRHGLQMAHLLVTHFGRGGAIEARKLLERDASKGQRLLTAFNDEVRHWLDFFCFTAFVDRDGKYQLTMLRSSAFHPLAASMGPMLKEEAFHLGTGVTGLRRVVRAGVVPLAVVQRHVNWWVSAAYDLFGNDGSASAERAYEWGLKGRFDEATAAPAGPAERGRLNEHNRGLYAAEVRGVLDLVNRDRKPGQPALVAPDERFHRRVGPHAGQRWSAAGELLDDTAYPAHLAGALPTAEDRARMQEWTKEAWLAPRAT